MSFAKIKEASRRGHYKEWEKTIARSVVDEDVVLAFLDCVLVFASSASYCSMSRK